MVITLAIGGTMVFRRYQTEAAIGFLLGVTSMMSQMFFLLFLIFMSFSHYPQYGHNPGADNWYSAFAFILSASYGLVAASLAYYRHDLLPSNEQIVSSSNTTRASGKQPSTVDV
jgi:ABC-type Fe3+-siderophore transport system permease subunit